ncbi:hypothetical protein OEB99_02810 [Actinotalea sp. M2MS4P-6]|uniref:hypothetical protein n=1 Tax=Actinotalea sp. M2MS4P-6 TaxID=2983762 RepID=UPI0021E37CAF|nr:hypothetical protein [Actinotalea sp. M2MS4P-6]MCV2393229.1 hypothetical protein [Actinotalea sp. M2MS4P-6]
MNLADAFEQIAAGAADRGGLDDTELADVLASTRRGRRRFAGTVVAGLAGAAAAGALGLSLLHLGGTPQPPVAPTQTIDPTPAPSTSPSPTGSWPSAATVAAVPQCEDAAPVLDAPAGAQLVLTVDPIDGVLPADQAVIPTASLASDVGFYGKAGGPITIAVVAREGPWAGSVVAVGTGAMTASPVGSTEPTSSLVSPGPVVLTSCIPGLRGRSSENEVVSLDMLPNGAYDLYEVVPLAAVTVDDVAYGGPGTLLLAAGPRTLEIGDPEPVPSSAPDLPTCGQSAAGLEPTALGQVSAETTWQRNGGAPYFSVAVVDDGPASYGDVRFTELSWVITQDGVVVNAGAQPASGPQVGTTLGRHSRVNAEDLVSLGGIADCRTGEPLDESIPIEIWTRSVVGVDLTPALGDDADAEVALISAASWFAYDPAPVPADVPVVGGGATTFDGVDAQDFDQIGDQAWVVGQSWTDAATWDRIKAAMAGAGYALADEQTHRAPDHDGIDRASGTFRGGSWTVVVDAANDTGGGWLATWQVSAG